MPKKRRNNGRNKKNRGHVKSVVCCASRRLVPKDKAIKKFVVKDIIDGSSRDDIQNNSALKGNNPIPKTYIKLYYCVSSACHNKTVRVRSRVDRRIRTLKRKKKVINTNKKDMENKENTPAVQV